MRWITWQPCITELNIPRFLPHWTKKVHRAQRPPRPGNTADERPRGETRPPSFDILYRTPSSQGPQIASVNPGD